MTENQFSVRYSHLLFPQEVNQEIKALLEKAKDAANQAYAPYSGFKVGCAILLENGKIAVGNNQENAAYPSGLCAERVALFHAMAENPELAIQKIAVVAPGKSNSEVIEPATPCGSCRQAMAEYESRQKKPIEIFLWDQNVNVWLFHSVSDLLPFYFTGKNLQ